MDGRCEYKYALGPGMKEELMRRIAENIPPDQYGGGLPYTVSSLYFDSDDRRLYYQTQNREPYRYKLRLRCYAGESAAGESATGESPSFFEIKSKLCGRSVKRRLPLALGASERLFREWQLPDAPRREQNLARDILTRITDDQLSPAAVVSYERLAFAAPGEERLRITFDSKLRIRTDRLDLRAGTDGLTIMPDDCCVLEVKSNTNLPLWLTRMVGTHGLANLSYSKYGHTPFPELRLTNIPGTGNAVHHLSQGEIKWVTQSTESLAISDRSTQAPFFSIS